MSIHVNLHFNYDAGSVAAFEYCQKYTMGFI